MKALDSELPRELVTEIAPGDGMYTGDTQYYLQVGRSAIHCIQAALDCTVKEKSSIRSVLDFACGFGRVTRWLVTTFPDAQVTAMDVDCKAVQAVSKLLPVSTLAIDSNWQSVPRDRYDLIWCGSLFTHISRQKSQELFSVLFERLCPGGVLAATTHGTFVAERLRRREKTYGLTDAATDGLLRDYDSTDYGFRPYEGAADYGISICKPYTVMEIASKARLTPLLFLERGWVRHQDVVGFTR